MRKLPEISLFFPVYNDEKTIRQVTEKALHFLHDSAIKYEVLIIDDGSPDHCGAIADELASQYPEVRVVHHPRNLGYGAALKDGFQNSRYEIICFTDGDDEYDINEFYKIMKLIDFYDLVITFRYKRMYSGLRIIISRVYNAILRFMFKINYRDINTGLRMVRKSVVQDVSLTSDGPFLGAELTLKLTLKGYRVGEMGIQTFPRKFTKGSAVTFRSICATLRDIFIVHKEVFSSDYDLDEKQKIRRNE